MINFRATFCVPLVLVSALLCGCALKERTVEPLPRTFLEDVDIGEKKENLPFDHAWVRPGTHKADYRSVYFKPVRVDLLPRNQWMRSKSVLVTSEEDYMEKAREVAAYFRQQLIAETRKKGGRNPRLLVTNTPVADTLVVEFVLTELELPHPAVRAGSLLAPIPGTGPAVAAMSDPHVAFAARITDGNAGELLATAADRKFAPTRVVDLNKLTVSSSAREVVALWAESIGAALQGDRFSVIEEKHFEVLPW